MNIGAISNYQTEFYFVKKTTNRSEGVKANGISFSAEMGNQPNMSPLDYYRNLCEEFPDVTFRLDDLATAARKESSDNVYFGYNNSMNQMGKGFGKKGQCSINLDVSVIEKMQKDPKYAEDVKGIIMDTQSRYSELEAGALREGYSYISVMIEDENGAPRRGVVCSNYPYSTEDEINKMWAANHLADKFRKRFEVNKNAMLDNYLKIMDDSQKKQIKFERLS